MILKEVVLHNFGPFRGRTAIDLSPTAPLGQRPVVLFGALNGSGKTSFLDALLLALYGSRARCSTRGSRSYQDFLRECINTRTPPAEGASVSVTFDYVTTRAHAEFRVERSWKVSNQRVVEQCQVYQNGKADVELTETWAERVEGIIPLGISNLFFFDGEQVRSIASDDLPSEEVKEAIRTLLGIELPEQLRADLLVIANRKRKLLVVDPKTKATLEDREKELKKAIQARAQHAMLLGILKNELAARERELAKSQESFTTTGGRAAQRRGEIEGRLQEAQRKLAGARSRLAELASGALPIVLMLPLIKRAKGAAALENQKNEEQIAAPVLESQGRELLEEFASRGASSEAISLLREVIEAARLRRSQQTSQRLFHASSSDLALVERQLEEAILQADAVEALLGEVGTLEESCRGLEARLVVAAPSETMQAGLRAVTEAHDRLALVRTQMAEVEGQHTAAEQLVGRLEREIQVLRAELSIDAAAMNEDARILRGAERVLGVMEQYQQRLLLRRVHELERHIGERFRYLHRKEGMVHTVRLDAATFQLSLFDDEGLPILRERMSAGEQQLLAVAFLWGLSLASGRRLPIVIDTPLGRMDHTHRRNIVERYFPAASHQVILLSTDAEVDREYHRVLSESGSIDREYLLQYSSELRGSQVKTGYFWS